MSRIIGDIVVSTRTLEVARIEKVISQHFAQKVSTARAFGRRVRNLNHERMKSEMLQVVNLVISQKIEEGFRLDLSDKTITKALGVSNRRAKQLRLELKAAGVVWFPEWSRQKKVGDYPYWMVIKQFIKFPKFHKKVSTPKTSKKYDQRWCKLYDQAKRSVFADLELYSMVVTVKQFMIMVYQTVNFYIAQLGLTKESFLR